MTSQSDSFSPDPTTSASPAGQKLLRFLEDRDNRTEESDVEAAALAVWNGERNLLLSDGRRDYHMTDWSFRQVCRLSGAPPDYINRLPGDLAAQVLNATRGLFGDQRDVGRLLAERPPFPSRGNPTLRAVYSPDYARVPDLVVARLIHQEATGFVPAGEVAGRHVGMPPVRPERSGLYGSDRDIWLFLADEDNAVEWKPPGGSGGGGAFYRFLIVVNSETTARRIGLTMGLCEGICGNHLIWNASEAVVWERRHVGDPAKILEYLRRSIEALRDRRTLHQELAVLQEAAKATFASTQDEFIEKLYPDVTKQLAARAWDSAVMDFHAALPLSVWNAVQGLTRVSQSLGYQDRRMDVDRVAGKLLATVAS